MAHWIELLGAVCLFVFLLVATTTPRRQQLLSLFACAGWKRARVASNECVSYAIIINIFEPQRGGAEFSGKLITSRVCTVGGDLWVAMFFVWRRSLALGNAIKSCSKQERWRVAVFDTSPFIDRWQWAQIWIRGKSDPDSPAGSSWPFSL